MAKKRVSRGKWVMTPARRAYYMSRSKSKKTRALGKELKRQIRRRG